MEQQKKLTKVAEKKVVAGVCNGFGKYFGIDPTIVRVITVAFTLVTGFMIGLLAYTILAATLPEEKAEDSNAAAPQIKDDNNNQPTPIQ